MAAHLTRFSKKTTVIGLVGFGTGGPDGWRKEWKDTTKVERNNEVPLEKIALHLHDTYGRALVNVQAGYEAGVRIFDASLGGLGGCPYAPGAAGNVATEDVVDLFEGAGISTGVDLDRLVDTTGWLESDVLERRLPGRVYRAVRGRRSGG